MKFAKDLNLLEGPKYDANADLSPLQQQDLITRIKSIEKNRSKIDLKIQEEIIKTFDEELKLNIVMQDTASHFKL